MRIIFLLSCLFMAALSKASTIKLNVANPTGTSACILYVNYKNLQTDTLLKFNLNAGNATATQVDLPRDGFYNLLIGKYAIPVFLESGQDYTIAVDYATYPKGYSVNGRTTLNELLYKMNNEWMYAKKLPDEAQQLKQINDYYHHYNTEIQDNKALSDKEAAIIKTLLDGIVNIMKLNAAFDLGVSHYTINPFTSQLQDFSVKSPVAYQAFPEKFLKSMAYNSYALKYGESADVNPERYLDYLYAIIPDKAFREFLSAQFVSGNIITFDKPEADRVLAILRTKITSDELLQNVTKKIVRTYQKNVQLPSLLLYNTNKQPVSTDSFKDKLVLIDVWALWCGPCMEERPFMDSLANHFKNDKRLVVLQVSIDQDQSEWLKSVKGSQNSHYWVDGGFNAEFSRALDIISIPRFILVNEKGLIIEPNAPRPSGSELYAIINKELDRLGK